MRGMKCMNRTAALRAGCSPVARAAARSLLPRRTRGSARVGVRATRPTPPARLRLIGTCGTRVRASDRSVAVYASRPPESPERARHTEEDHDPQNVPGPAPSVVVERSRTDRSSSSAASPLDVPGVRGAPPAVSPPVAHGWDEEEEHDCHPNQPPRAHHGDLAFVHSTSAQSEPSPRTGETGERAGRNAARVPSPWHSARTANGMARIRTALAVVLGLASGWLIACTASPAPPPGTVAPPPPTEPRSASSPGDEGTSTERAAPVSPPPKPAADTQGAAARTRAAPPSAGSAEAAANAALRKPVDGGVDASAPIVDAAPIAPAVPPAPLNDPMRPKSKVRPVFPDAGAIPL